MKKNISSFLAGNTAQQPEEKKKRLEPKQHEAEIEYENEEEEQEEGYQPSLSVGSETTVSTLKTTNTRGTSQSSSSSSSSSPSSSSSLITSNDSLYLSDHTEFVPIIIDESGNTPTAVKEGREEETASEPANRTASGVDRHGKMGTTPKRSPKPAPNSRKRSEWRGKNSSKLKKKMFQRLYPPQSHVVLQDTRMAIERTMTYTWPARQQLGRFSIFRYHVVAIPVP
jgi:hypothetical protein